MPKVPTCRYRNVIISGNTTNNTTDGINGVLLQFALRDRDIPVYSKSRN